MQTADPWLNLGTAMAISGAAFSPNMGTFTLKPLTALMTFFNIRLGYWLPNPLAFQSKIRFSREMLVKPLTCWQEYDFQKAVDGDCHPPRKYLFKEAFSNMSADRDAFVNVSDGGHIENLAIYPLLQRRCRLIVALDGEADKDRHFEGLATTIRLARINLNVHIEMNHDEMEAIRTGTRHSAFGTIWYGSDRWGTLLYIKASLCKKLSLVDIQHYKACHPDFPHESTMDQFFDEEQFESYRALGYHVAQEVFS
ncbi:MAG: hypothetical protein H7839_08380 [Magnetococcus sp. YQC-5]